MGNFGRSCIALKANEKAFQAWYAACVIQEFGLSRVYREVHLAKDELFCLAPPEALTAGLTEGNELFPDLSVSWQPDVDARHTSTRHEGCREAGLMLRQFGILSELKVTGSTGNPTGPRAIRQDLAKLCAFAGAHRAPRPDVDTLATYMVVLDNFCATHECFRPHYADGRLDELLSSVSREWPEEVRKPVVMLLHPASDGASIQTYRDFARSEGTRNDTGPIMRLSDE